MWQVSAFEEGRVYRGLDGQPILCWARRFTGALGTCETVALATTDDSCWVENGKSVPFIVRTARAAADVVVPRITETLGGVFRPDLCDHYSIKKRGPDLVTANAGPHAGRVCCSLCGAPPAPTPRENQP